jgi:hypothetical protein
MKYFILYTLEDSYIHETYLKGMTYKQVFEQIQHYSNGLLSTDKETLITSNISHGYLREVDPKEFPVLTKRDFDEIDEENSFSSLDDHLYK